MRLPVMPFAPGLHSWAQRVPAYPVPPPPPPPQVGVAGMLEAATLLLRQGWRPRRTLYFAFGQDEEVGGELGAGGRGRGEAGGRWAGARGSWGKLVMSGVLLGVTGAGTSMELGGDGLVRIQLHAPTAAAAAPAPGGPRAHR